MRVLSITVILNDIIVGMKRVAVLRGGPSGEYSVSMKTGQAVLEALGTLDYKFKDIVITKQGEWLTGGFAQTPDRALEGIDVVFLALHGEFGEDGRVQRIMQRLNLPFTGSNALPSAIAFNKDLTKQTLKKYGVKMPRHRRFSKHELETLEEEIDNIVSEIGHEVFIKPLASGSSLGAKHVPNSANLKHEIINLAELYDELMIEEFVRGKEATVGVLNNFRDEEFYALPVVEILPPRSDTFYSNSNKYDGSTELVCPGRFSYHEKARLAETASLVHKVIGLNQYSRSDFIVKDGEIYFLEVNTLPGLTAHSLFPRSAGAIGLDFSQLVKHLIDTASV